MKFAHFLEYEAVQSVNSPTVSISPTPLQSVFTTPAAGLVALPTFAVLLVLLLQGTRSLCFGAYDVMYTRYRNHRLSLRCQQIAELERIFRTPPSSN
jgi:hypothetical protein